MNHAKSDNTFLLNSTIWWYWARFTERS